MAVALKRKEDTLKREKAPSDDGDNASTMAVGFDVRRRKTQGAWKNAGKAIMASNNLQKLKALNKSAAAGGGGSAGGSAPAPAPAEGQGGLSRGRTLSGNPVRNDAATLAQVAALSLSTSPIESALPQAETADGQDALSLMRPRSAAAMKRAMGLDRTASARSIDGTSPSVALRRAVSNGIDDADGLGSTAIAEDLKDRLGSVEDAVDNMGAQLSIIQDALEAQSKLLRQILEQQRQPFPNAARGTGGQETTLGSDSDSATVLAAEREIAKSITARSPENRAPVAPPTAPPSGARRKSTAQQEGDLNLEEDLSNMDVEALLAVRADGAL